MSVSYANVAANGSKDSPETAPASLAAPLAPEALTPAAPQETAAEPTEAAPVEDAPVPKKEKKILAPAPVPTKSVWGASAPAPKTASVDEHKWPTPDKVADAPASKATRFIKPNKWVPIPAKVTLPSARPQQNGQQKPKRKSKPRKKDEIIKKDDVKNVEDVEEAEDDLHQHQQDPDQHDGLRPRYQKNYRRFQNSPRQNGAVNGQTPNGLAPRAANGFYPQFVPQGYQNYNRQYRPNYRRNNSNGNLNQNGNLNNLSINGNAVNGAVNPAPYGYRMGFAPHIAHQPLAQGISMYPVPVQIPPPISPKQDPLQALTQQIDYYFSLDNLIRDVYLRRNMGTEGWIDLDLILNFKRVKIITNGLANSVEEQDEEKRAAELDRAIMTAVQRCVNLELGYLNGKDAHDATATEVQLRVLSNFEQWLLPDN